MSALMQTYAPLPVSFDRGEGPLVFDTEGRRYLDGLSGIAVTNLGHAHPAVTEAIAEQSARLLHCSNLYRIDAQEEAGALLTARAGMERVFFSNSGAEANEAAIKLARLHAHQRGIEKPRVIVLEGAFHGRTLATLSAGGNRKIQAGFSPLVDGFIRAPRNDLGALEKIAASSRDVAAVLLEPVQGESGVHVLDTDYLKAVRKLCDTQGWLLMFDEVQTGNGRTGSYFYYQQLGFTPDVVTTAKALGNGVPVGACLARGEASEVFSPGNHGSTYGGNPLACAAARAVLQCHNNDQLISRAPVIAQQLLSSFEASLGHRAAVAELRHAGAMIGIELVGECGDLPGKALEAGVLLNVTAGSTIRLLPPLVMSDEQARELGATVAQLVDQWAADSQQFAGAA